MPTIIRYGFLSDYCPWNSLLSMRFGMGGEGQFAPSLLRTNGVPASMELDGPSLSASSAPASAE